MTAVITFGNICPLIPWLAPTTNAYFSVSRPEFSRFQRLIVVDDEYHLFSTTELSSAKADFSFT